MIRLLLDRLTLAMLVGLGVMALVAAAEPSRPEILLEATTKTVQPVPAQAADGLPTCTMPQGGPLLVMPAPDDGVADDGAEQSASSIA